MKIAAKKGKARKGGRGAEDFYRGCIVSACLSAFQDVPRPASARAAQRILRHALQGGTALAAGSRAAARLDRGDYAGALMAAAAGAAGVFLIEQLLGADAPANREHKHGQEA